MMMLMKKIDEKNYFFVVDHVHHHDDNKQQCRKTCRTIEVGIEGTIFFIFYFLMNLSIFIILSSNDNMILRKKENK